MAILAIAIFALPLNGAHLHLCFDGAEPLVSVHAVDDQPTHHDGAVAQSHNDMDVLLSNGEAPQPDSKFKIALPLLAVALVALVSFFNLPVSIRRRRIVQSLPSFNFLLLPPLRGPPALDLR